MIGQTISHYRILEKLGEGGMGVVYKAQDTKLNRTVALKFLPDRVNQDVAAKARFIQEAQAAAGLNHSNICTIYGVDEHEGHVFISMEYVEGGTLRQQIPFARSEDALVIASQIGEALQEAHTKGIVHRDVKADNIMLTAKGQAKVMDFGLAKLKGALKITRTSSTVGTLGYMAPEQIQGGEVDHRSDIFSFGVLLFEMLSGKLPFRGEHEAAMVYSIVNEPPQDIAALKPDLSPIVANLIHRCLEKDPSERYQHFDDVTADLRRSQKHTSRVMRSSADPVAAPGDSSGAPGSPHTTAILTRGPRLYAGLAAALTLLAVVVFVMNPFSGTGAGPSDKTRLVVLPFQNQGSSDQDYFVDGITEEVIGRLSSLSGLAVIARSSAMQYKGTSKTLKEIGQELGVTYALLGTVRWSKQTGSEDRIRVNPELVKIDDATQIWSQPFEAAYSGGFELQAKIASQVAGALGVSLLSPESRSLEAPLTDNAEAYGFYLKGKNYLQRGLEDKVSFEFGEQMYKKAIELDPTFSAAWAELSILHSQMRWFHWDLSEQRVLDAKAAADKALQLAPASALSHTALAEYYYHGRLEYAPALESYRKALAIDPNSVEALAGVGAVLRRQGKMQEALGYYERVSELDPRSAQVALELGWTQANLRNYSAASQSYERAIVLAPDEVVYYIYEATLVVEWKADLVWARRVLATAQERNVPDHTHFVDRTMARLYFLGRDYQKALLHLKTAGPLALDDQSYFTPASLLKGLILQSAGTGNPRTEFEAARVFLEQKIREAPDDSRLYTSLAIALAGLGRKDEAIRKGKEGVAILPVTKEAVRGANRELELATVYAMVGEHELALDRLEHIPPFSSVPTYGDLKSNPVWDSLRELPRFKTLLSSLAPKD